MKTAEEYLALPYTVVLRRDEDGDIVARISEFEGCSAHGSDEAEAIANLREVQTNWVSMRLEAGFEVPAPFQDEELPSGNSSEGGENVETVKDYGRVRNFLIHLACWVGLHDYQLISSEPWNTDVFGRGPNNAIQKVYRCDSCGKCRMEYIQ